MFSFSQHIDAVRQLVVRYVYQSSNTVSITTIYRIGYEGNDDTMGSRTTRASPKSTVQ